MEKEFRGGSGESVLGVDVNVLRGNLNIVRLVNYLTEENKNIEDLSLEEVDNIIKQIISHL